MTVEDWWWCVCVWAINFNVYTVLKKRFPFIQSVRYWDFENSII